MAKTSIKKYLVIYQSQEHHEVVGYVRASSVKEAIARAQKELKEEARFYDVKEAIIGELKGEQRIIFDIE